MKSEARKAFIGTLIAIALNPFSLVLGYFINDYLQSSKLSIKSIVSEPYWFAESVDPNVLETLKANKSLVASIRSEVELARLGPNSVDWLEGKPLGTEVASQLLPVLRRMLESLRVASETLSENQRILEKWKPGEPLRLQPMPYMLPSLIRIEDTARTDKASAIAALQSARKDPEQCVEGLNALIPAIAKLSTVSSEQPPDFIKLTVGVLNFGASDGVIYAKDAFLFFGDTQLPLKAEKFTVVKAHSFEEIEFEVDEDNGTPKALERWNSLLKKHAQEPFQVELTNDRNKKIRGYGRLEP